MNNDFSFMILVFVSISILISMSCAVLGLTGLRDEQTIFFWQSKDVGGVCFALFYYTHISFV
jgi:fructose-specific phosphotransferase system IIC component